MELQRYQYAMCWLTDGSDVRNVVCYGSDCSMIWQIGVAEGHPPWPYSSITLKPDGRLVAYPKGWGYLAVVDQQTGSIIETIQGKW